jgi:signal transduction histidine kinase
MTYRPTLRTVLLLLNLLVLLLPLGGIAAFRLYESELVKQTESELISQAALTAAMFREIYQKQAGAPKPTGRQSNPPAPAIAEPAPLAPLPPQLDLATSRIREPALAAETPTVSPDPLALVAGRELNAVLADARRIMLSGIRIVDGNGIVVASSNAEAGLSLAHREEVATALTGTPTSLLRVRNSDELPPALGSLSRGARVRVFVAVPVIVADRVVGAVVASRTPLDAAKALYPIRDRLLQVSLGVVLLVLVMTLLTAYYINRPVKALIRQAERLQNGEPGGTEPLANPGIQEVAQLSTAIARMATTLEERAGYIKTFAANVSHEFKTPLTSIHGAVELLKEHFPEMNEAERERFLGIIDQETERLGRLVRRLLDLARADTLAPGSEQCDALPLLEELAQRYRDQGLRVELTDCTDPLPLRMARETFETIVANLIENARQHGGDGVSVRLRGEVTSAGAERLFALEVRDTGPGISAGNRERVFRPFFTTARDTGGSGLGLAIVQALLRAHGGEITLEPSDTGARFRLQLPLG